MEAYRTISTEIEIHLHPARLDDVEAGIREQLDHILFSYVEEFGGIVIVYRKLKMLSDKAKILQCYPHMHFPVSVDFLVFAPQVGQVLTGVVQTVEPDHVKLLVDSVFPVTISNEHFPASFSYDEETTSWLNADDEDLPLRRESVVKFYVLNLSYWDEYFFLTGSLLEDSTGVIRSPEPTPLTMIKLEPGVKTEDGVSTKSATKAKSKLVKAEVKGQTVKVKLEEEPTSDSTQIEADEDSSSGKAKTNKKKEKRKEKAAVKAEKQEKKKKRKLESGNAATIKQEVDE